MYARIWIPVLFAGGLSSLALAQDAEAPASDTAIQLKAIVVSGEAGAEAVAKDSSTATKTGTPLVETPQSITVITREEMDQRNVQSVLDAVAYVAGVQSEADGMDSRVDGISIRGFDAGGFSNNVYYDGLRTPTGGQWTRTQFDTFGMQSVEVL